jgi:type III secretion HrpO family protein
MMDTIVAITQKGMWLSLLLSLPVVITALVVGLAVAVFQAATQIQDQGLPTTAKLIVGLLALLASQAWIAAELNHFGEQIFALIRKI